MDDLLMDDLLDDPQVKLGTRAMSKNIFGRITKNDDRIESEPIVNYHVKRLGYTGENIKKAKEALYDYADWVAMIESNGNTNAQNPRSSAAGAFQFIREARAPAINRVKKANPRWSSGADEDITKWSYDKQRALALGDLLEKTIEKTPGKGDELFKRIIDGDKEAWKEMYYKGHHTAPDAATKRRVEKILAEEPWKLRHWK